MISEERKKEIQEYNKRIMKARKTIFRILSALAFLMAFATCASYTIKQECVFGFTTICLMIAANNFYDD